LRPLLEGLRVVDIASTEGGARVTQFLADQGATVEMIEKPGGSPLRQLAGWPSLGRGKRSRVMDISTKQGMAGLVDLISTSDVLVHAMRPAAVDALGLNYSALTEANPRIVVASITGFGRLGPFSGLKGYEGIVMAKLGVYQGFERATRRAGQTFVPVPYASYCVSQTAIQGILAALLERERSGLGQQVEANMAQAIATMDCWMWFLRVLSDRYPGAYTQVGAYDEDGNPNAHQVLTLLVAATSDNRWLQFAQLQPHLFAAFLRALDMDDLMEEAGWSGLPIYESKEKRTAVWERMLDAVASCSLAEWYEKFDRDRDVFAELFRSGTEVLDHPALCETGWVVRTEDPSIGPMRQLGRMVRVAGEDWVPAPSPPLGGGRAPAGAEAGSGWQATNEAVRPVRAAPLDGITILDLCVWYAAPYATTLLTDLGARVIHVEPLVGDPIRMAAGFPEAGGLKVMQGKESIAVDLSTPEGRDIVHELAKGSSAVLQGFRAGVAEKLGLDFQSLRALNPNLVYVDATGYGVGGPYADRPSYAPSIADAAGLTMANVEQHLGSEPAVSVAARKERAVRLSAGASAPAINADGLSALGSSSALLLGLLSAARGHAPQLETTMLSTTASVNFEALIEGAGVAPSRPDSELLGLNALYRLYESLDGWIFLAVLKEREWDDLAKILEPYISLRDDPRFTNPAARVVNDSELAQLLATVFRTRRGAEWEGDMSQRDVACVVSSKDSTEGMLMSGEVGGASGYVAEVTHPLLDEHPRLAPVIRFSRSETRVRPACLAGQHTEAILRELGMDADRIADLQERHIVSLGGSTR
jgi:crotonobetainyl-CoA:carnitine CoA-transferase CaiB-like acyl-CoA transferase